MPAILTPADGARICPKGEGVKRLRAGWTAQGGTSRRPRCRPGAHHALVRGHLTQTGFGIRTLMRIGSSGGHELLLFTASGWVIAVGAVISHFWTGFSSMANYAPIVLWCVLVVFAAMRLGRPTFWLVLSGPIVVLSPILWLFLIIARCYIFPSPQGCF